MFAATSQKVLLAFCILIYYAIFAASLAEHACCIATIWLLSQHNIHEIIKTEENL